MAKNYVLSAYCLRRQKIKAYFTKTGEDLPGYLPVFLNLCFWLHPVAYGIFPEPAPSAVEAQSLNHWTARKSVPVFLSESLSDVRDSELWVSCQLWGGGTSSKASSELDHISQL